MLDVVALPADVRLIEEPPPPPPAPAVIETVEGLWRHAAKNGLCLTDGRMFNLVRRSGADLAGYLVPFSWYWAQRHEPTLYDALGITGLGVSGLVRSPDGLVFALRGAAVAADAGLWELAPSGGVDDVCRDSDGVLSPLFALLTELEEELNVPRDRASKARPFVLVDDRAAHVCDIGFDIDVDCSAAELATCFAARHTAEYEDMVIVPPADLDAFLEAHDGKVLPTSVALLRAAGLSR